MKNHLQLNTSLHGAGSRSSRLASEFIATLAQSDRVVDGAGAGSRNIVRDLAGQPLPHSTRPASAWNSSPPDAARDSALLQRRTRQALSISQARNRR